MFSVGGFDGRDSGSLNAATSARCPCITQRVNGPGSGFPLTLTMEVSSDLHEVPGMTEQLGRFVEK